MGSTSVRWRRCRSHRDQRFVDVVNSVDTAPVELDAIPPSMRVHDVSPRRQDASASLWLLAAAAMANAVHSGAVKGSPERKTFLILNPGREGGSETLAGEMRSVRTTRSPCLTASQPREAPRTSTAGGMVVPALKDGRPGEWTRAAGRRKTARTGAPAARGSTGAPSRRGRRRRRTASGGRRGRRGHGRRRRGGAARSALVYLSRETPNPAPPSTPSRVPPCLSGIRSHQP